MQATTIQPAGSGRRRGRPSGAAVVGLALAALCSAIAFTGPVAAADKPNILVIWGDDIGTWNISHNNRGMMGYRTPNIDRIADEGVGFTDYYAQQSCTAGRAAFIGGSVPVRSGMTKVGLPGAKEGWQKTDVTMTTVLKGQGYATGQFGKNHQGDRDEHLPTMHGFDEFLGNLYHLNAEEEPENMDYPKDPEFLKKFGPRGVLHTWADGKGGQRIENTVAYKALTDAGQGAEGGSAPAFSGGAVPVGMTAAQTPADHQVLANTAELVIQGMINAAKADGEVSAAEIARFVGKLKAAGMDGDAEAWIMKELRQPLDLDAFAAAIPNQEVAAQVYAASLLAIEVDTPQEQAYLADLAKKTGLDAAVVQNIQQTLGVKV